MDKMTFARKYPPQQDGLVRAPERKHPTDAGLDVFSAEDLLLWPLSSRIVRTGVHLEVPPGYALQVWPKSRHDWLVGAGIIDSGYKGEVLVKLVNPYLRFYRIQAGQPLAQLVLVSIATPELAEVSLGEYLASRSSRGATGGIVTQAASK